MHTGDSPFDLDTHILLQGPRGLDKILISPDGDITVTNDGATILGQVRSTRPLFPPANEYPFNSNPR